MHKSRLVELARIFEEIPRADETGQVCSVAIRTLRSFPLICVRTKL